MARKSPLERLQGEITRCERCPRLREHCQRVAQEKRAAFREWEYWGRPVPGFGDPDARILIVGLAPAAHGGNRTGRVFTGDRSADFLFAGLHRAGLANQSISISREDGLSLSGVYITAAARCAPPANKPAAEELDNCIEFLERELGLLKQVRVAMTLGKIGHDALIKALKRRGLLESSHRCVFSHGAVHRLPAPLPTIVCSYHVSQQNTFTGKLTPAMFDHVIRTSMKLAQL